MTLSTEWPTAAEVVSRLRTAGCVFAEDEYRLLRAAVATPQALADLVTQRLDGLPLEHLLGWVEFCGRRVAVDPGVFIPRRRTEVLVREAGALARGGDVLADLGCGAGAVAYAIACAVPGLEVYAADVEPTAAQCARRNLEPLGAHVLCGDLFDPLPASLRGRIAVLTANLPYVPTGALELMPVEARRYEPRVTHDGGPDGLDPLRRLAGEAPPWLAHGGHLLTETGAEQAETAVAILAEVGMRAWSVTDDELAGTVVIGRREFRS